MVGLRAKRPHFTEKWLRFTLHFVAHFYSARNSANKSDIALGKNGLHFLGHRGTCGGKIDHQPDLAARSNLFRHSGNNIRHRKAEQNCFNCRSDFLRGAQALRAQIHNPLDCFSVQVIDVQLMACAHQTGRKMDPDVSDPDQTDLHSEAFLSVARPGAPAPAHTLWIASQSKRSSPC